MKNTISKISDQDSFHIFFMNDYQLGKYDSVLVHIEKAIELDPSNLIPLNH